MTIMIVAHKSKLRGLMNVLLEVYPNDIIVPIDDGMSAVQFAYHNPVDKVYAEINTPTVNGFTVGDLIRKERPHAALHLIADSERALQTASCKGFDGYYLNPVSAHSLLAENMLACEAV